MKYLSYITRTDPLTGQLTAPNGKRKIFISYKHSDEEELPLCRQLASLILEKLDVAVWYDDRLTAGKDYDEEIRFAIRSSDAFILLLTPNILSSEYILKNEIPYAQENQVAIIPVVTGLSENELSRVEEIVGRVHIPTWFQGKRDAVPEFPTETLRQFISGLERSIANKDLLLEATLFYERGEHNVSMRHLTPEQVFIKAYGCLFGIGDTSEKELGVKLLESILSSYGTDSDFLELQAQASIELLKHLYRSNQPKLFFTYLRNALEKGSPDTIDLLFDVYRTEWHPELMRNEADLSFELFKSLYKKHFGYVWDSAKVARKLDAVSPLPPATSSKSPPNAPRVGEIVCDGYTAYLMKSATEEKTVDLWANDLFINDFPLSQGYGDVYMIFMAYDPKYRILATLHSDFDHYGPETLISGAVYRFDPDGIRIIPFSSDWIVGLRQLPYTPRTFHIE